MFFQCAAAADCDAAGHGIKDMDAGENIGRCINCIKISDHVDKNIIPFKASWAQRMSVGP